MYRFERLRVGPGLSNRDEALLRYADMLSRLAGSQEAHFLHAMEPVEIPEEIVQKYVTGRVPL